MAQQAELLTTAAFQYLSDNWPEDKKQQREMAAMFGCKVSTLNAFAKGITMNPRADLVQRIYEHFSGKALLSA